MQFEVKRSAIVGDAGSLTVAQDDEVTRRLFMLVEGECSELGPLRAAGKFGFSKQRYYQLRAAYQTHGALGLLAQKRGPKSHYRRTDELVRQVIRHRFLDPDASVEVIAQKLKQSGFAISIRSVERVVAAFGLQKKTLSLPAES
jgi:transposase